MICVGNFICFIGAASHFFLVALFSRNNFALRQRRYVITISSLGIETGGNHFIIMHRIVWVIIVVAVSVSIFKFTQPSTPQVMEEYLRVVTYNILSSTYEDFHDYCPREHRRWPARFAKIKNQIADWDADILSFQELNSRAVQQNFQPFLSSEYSRAVSAGSRKGVGVFFKKSVLKLLHHQTTQFRDAWDTVSDQFRMANKTSELIEATMDMRDDKALFCHFKHIFNDKSFVFVTTHLFHDPKFPDIKLLQTQCLLSLLETFLKSRSLNISTTPVIITGDFNSLPIKYLTDPFDDVPTADGLISGVYELLSNGSVSENHPQHPNARETWRERKKNRKKDISQFQLFKELKHPFGLQSVYKSYFGEEPKITTKTDTFQGNEILQ